MQHALKLDESQLCTALLLNRQSRIVVSSRASRTTLPRWEISARLQSLVPRPQLQLSAPPLRRLLPQLQEVLPTLPLQLQATAAQLQRQQPAEKGGLVRLQSPQPPLTSGPQAVPGNSSRHAAR